MTELLIKIFIKDYKTIDGKTREKFGILASFVGIFSNVLLFAIKLIVGIVLNSISIIADSFNNLSDSLSSIIALIGFKMAGKPPDADHPFGHGRIEYISSLIVSFIIMLVGWEFLKSSYNKIINPQELRFSFILIFILISTILVKLWLSIFYKKIAKKIDSKTLEATSKDSQNDVIVTSGTIISIIFSKVFNINIDGYVGIVIACILIYGGYSLVKDTVSSILGEAIPKDFANKIKKFVESYDGILGTHDLIVHNYGPTRTMATVHAEVSNENDIENAHAIIDKIESDALSELGIYLLIHMDPVDIKDKRIISIKDSIISILKSSEEKFDAHDFRLISSGNQTNVVFDLVVPYDFDNKKLSALMKKIKFEISKNTNFNLIVNVENSYIL